MNDIELIAGAAILGIAYLWLKPKSGLSTTVEGVGKVTTAVGNVAENAADVVNNMVNLPSNTVTLLAMMPEATKTFYGNITGDYGQAKINYKAADSAFAKIGLTTAEYQKFVAKYGFTEWQHVLQGLLGKTELTENMKNELFTIGWSGTSNYIGINYATAGLNYNFPLSD
jgi:hypothetical protein